MLNLFLSGLVAGSFFKDEACAKVDKERDTEPFDEVESEGKMCESGIKS